MLSAILAGCFGWRIQKEVTVFAASSLSGCSKKLGGFEEVTGHQVLTTSLVRISAQQIVASGEADFFSVRMIAGWTISRNWERRIQRLVAIC